MLCCCTLRFGAGALLCCCVMCCVALLIEIQSKNIYRVPYEVVDNIIKDDYAKSDHLSYIIYVLNITANHNYAYSQDTTEGSCDTTLWAGKVCMCPTAAQNGVTSFTCASAHYGVRFNDSGYHHRSTLQERMTTTTSAALVCPLAHHLLNSFS